MIEFNEQESLFVLAAKGWEPDNTGLMKGLLEEYYDLDNLVEKFKNDPINKFKNDEIKVLIKKNMESLITYRYLVKGYFIIYGSSFNSEIYDVLVEVMGDIVYKISPEKFKECVYNVHGIRPSLHRNILSEFNHAISSLKADEYTLTGKYLTKKYLEKQ